MKTAERPKQSVASVAREKGISWHAANKLLNSGACDPVADAQKRRDMARELSKERQLLEAVAGERSFRAFLESAIAEVAPKLEPPPAYKPRKPSPAATTETLLLCLSDWHAYEVVKASRTLGLNHYDGPTMGRRVHKVVDSVLSIKRRMEGGCGWRFPHLIVSANGDMISGTIHEVERHSDSPNVMMAAFGAGLVLASAIRDLAGDFESVTVYCTSGNHGRLPDARRVQQKDATRSWDTAVYLFAMSALSGCKNVRFHIPDSYAVIFESEGWRFLQSHGHDIKSWAGIPFYGINRKVSNMQAMRSSLGEPIDYFLFGHFHNSSNVYRSGSEVVINGSLIGGTEYGLNTYGDVDPPRQWLCGVHPDHGLTHRWPINAACGPDDPGYPVAAWEGL